MTGKRPANAARARRSGATTMVHKLYAVDAVDTPLPDLATPDKAALERAMNGHVLGQATLVGRYAKKGSKSPH
jgi:phosphatidylethanolamine-binding protein (PEBP) family uncharacterized protein